MTDQEMQQTARLVWQLLGPAERAQLSQRLTAFVSAATALTPPPPPAPWHEPWALTFLRQWADRRSHWNVY